MTIHEASDMTSSRTATLRVTKVALCPDVGNAELGFHENLPS